MNKKLIAVAIAGAFAAPAVAFAQSNTVNIYGTFNVEYGFSKGDGAALDPKVTGQSKSFNSSDAWNSGASNIGIKAEEKLGGGMSAFVQCESDIRFLAGAGAAGSLCDRNSAIGLKGGFGSVYAGNWDSPLKQAVGMTRMLGDTGWLGVTHLLLASGSSVTTPAVTGLTGTPAFAFDAVAKSKVSGTFSDRTGNSFNYDSPSFGGLQINLQTTTTAGDVGKAYAGTSGRANSMNVLYSKGPMKAALGYTKKDDNAATGGFDGAKDEAWTLGVSYNFGAPRIGFTYADMKVSGVAGNVTLAAVADGELDSALVGPGNETKRTVWSLAGEYDLPGPHSLWAGYTKAGDAKTRTAAGVVGGADTGATEIQIGYKNTLSKRTFAAIGYGRVNNDTNGKESVAGKLTPTVGDKSSSVINLQLSHKF